ncbi:glycosyltransferase [Pseudoclavibacter sp. CFCC 13796]|uniref:glycosyltransferase n=1 Tax=Pseudoclavibacter sp. CFCC 13796 TaxID=2615179 RepID=UPI0013012980|nr:glycosyltransferase [Pseudoclavibacter sp. CFCC 13796]KAB1661087.1 glycosyltransferase [Pseudoclavibacter sp. CFCC 13796]
MQSNTSAVDRGDRPKVFIYKTDLLPLSETFIRDQGDALRDFDPRYVGLFKTTSHPSLSRMTDTVFYPRTPFHRIQAKVSMHTGRVQALSRLIRTPSTRPALVHAHFLQSAMQIRISLAAQKIPLVVTLHGQDVTSYPDSPSRLGSFGVRLRHTAIRDTLDQASLIIAVSEFIREKAIALGAPSEKVIVHHIGTRIQAIQPSQPKKYDVLFVGRLVEKKGVATLIDALSTVSKQMPVHAAIIGDGPLRTELQRRATLSTAQIDFLGSQSHESVGELLLQSRLFCLPSQTAANGDSEGLPMVLLEAMGARLPIVSTRHSGIPEAVISRETGLLSAEADSSGLAADILTILSDSRLASEYGLRGRERLETSFSLSTQTRLLEEHYRAVLAGVY